MADSPQQLRVFVSHSHQDNTFCHAIVAALRDAGAEVWYDEHNMGWGELHEVIQREMGRRRIFVLILSKAIFTSKWVKRETKWAYKLYDRDPTRVILPITAGQIEATDFDPETGWLFLDDFKRIEAPGFMPYPIAEAVRRLLQALSLTPAGATPSLTAPQPTEDADDLLTRAKALIAQRLYAEALSLLDHAARLTPVSLNAWVDLGNALDRSGQSEEALRAYDRALALDDTQASVWLLKGFALYRLNRHEEALASFDGACTVDPHLADAWFDKGQVLDDLGRWQEALAAYDRALALNPNVEYVWDKKAVALHALGRDAEAGASEQRARELRRKE